MAVKTDDVINALINAKTCGKASASELAKRLGLDSGRNLTGARHSLTDKNLIKIKNGQWILQEPA